MRQENLRLIVNVERVDDVLAALAAYSAPYVEKWLELDET